MPWVLRGLRDGIVTSRFPRQPDDYGPAFFGSVQLLPGGPPPGPEVTRACPTGAIEVHDDQVTVDRGRCIGCGRCWTRAPATFAPDPTVASATLTRSALVIPLPEEDERQLQRVRADLSRKVRALRRSVHIRHVDAGSDGSEEWEVNALTNPVYDVQRLGVFFTASPRHADLLLVTGVGTPAMVDVLRRTYQAMPDPKVVLAAGTDAVSGGLVRPIRDPGGPLAQILPVDVFVPGSPPSPFSLLHGILLAIGLLRPRPEAPPPPGSEDRRPAALRGAEARP
jgi:Ni,Fe-hydrogenase III small subunit/ferredoxin